MTTYDLAYQLLPELVDSYNQGKEEQHHMVDKHYLRNTYKESEAFNYWQDIIIEHRPLSEYKSVGIYHFGETSYNEKPIFGLIFFDYLSQSATYYTLEKSLSDINEEAEWSVVQVNHPGLRLEYGPFIMRPTVNNFVEYVF